MKGYLTGRIRLHHHKKAGLVLEVEEKYLSSYWCGGFIDGEWVTHWRPAVVGEVPITVWNALHGVSLPTAP